jgi:hypothetical protein
LNFFGAVIGLKVTANLTLCSIRVHLRSSAVQLLSFIELQRVNADFVLGTKLDDLCFF